MLLFTGYDLSLNHGARVELTDLGGVGNLSTLSVNSPLDICFTFYTDKKKYTNPAKASTAHGTLIKLSDIDDRETAQRKRLSLIDCWHAGQLQHDAVNVIEFAGIEGYAYSAAQGAHQLGELGGK